MGEQAVADPVEEGLVGEPPQHRAGIERRPPCGREVEEARVVEQRVLEGVLAALATPLALDLTPQRVEEGLRNAADLLVPAALGHDRPTQVIEASTVELEYVVAVEEPEALRGPRDALSGGPPHDLGHPGRTLDLGHVRVVLANGANAVDDLTQ